MTMANEDQKINCWIVPDMGANSARNNEYINKMKLDVYKRDEERGMIWAKMTVEQIQLASKVALVGYDLYFGPKETCYGAKRS